VTADDLRSALRCGKPSCPCRSGQLTHCPAHNDSKPSLSVNDGGGTVLFKCHTGCDSKAVITALTERGLWPLSESVTPMRSPGRSEPDHLYRYMDVNGEVVGEKGRWDNPKRFAWRMPGDTGWGGGPSMDAMPLYNLADVLRNPAAPVFFVEGEKAVEACQSRGLVAVCTAGGAAQKRFGNALDVLATRTVVLWPDNDEPGQGFMGTVSAFIPDASMIRPVVPPKGDAYDYFEQGGTVESLLALIATSQPKATLTGYDSVNVTMPAAGGLVRFDFEQMVASGARALDCIMRVSVELTGQRRTPYSQRVNLYSASAIEGIVRVLKAMYPDKALEWTALMNDAGNMCSEVWRGVDRSRPMSEVELVAKREWLVEGIIPKNLVTVPFGMGGSLKSLMMAHLAICAYYGIPWMGLRTEAIHGVLVVDYEDTAEEWKLRWHEICGALDLPVPEDEAFRWMPGAGVPLVDQGETIRKIIERHNIDFVIVDSALSAVGGDLLDTAPAQRLMNWLTTLGVTTCLIAHNTKGGSTEYPYGSIFWHNLPRSTVYFEANGTSADKIRDVGIFPRKASRGAHSPLAARVTFGGDGLPLTVETLNGMPITKADAADDEIGLRWSIADLLKGGALTIVDIAASVGASDETVGRTLRRYRDYFQTVGKQGRAATWGLKAERAS